MAKTSPKPGNDQEREQLQNQCVECLHTENVVRRQRLYSFRSLTLIALLIPQEYSQEFDAITVWAVILEKGVLGE